MAILIETNLIHAFLAFFVVIFILKHLDSEYRSGFQTFPENVAVFINIAELLPFTKIWLISVSLSRSGGGHHREAGDRGQAGPGTDVDITAGGGRDTHE